MNNLVYAVKDPFSGKVVKSTNSRFRDFESFFKWTQKIGIFDQVYPVNDRICAFLEKREGRGSCRCWRAFFFDCGQIQADVEDFMIQTFNSPKYFLQMESWLDISPDYPFNYFHEGIFVYWTPVKIICMKTKRKFIIG